MSNTTLLGLAHILLGLILSVDVILHKYRPVSAVLWLGVLWVLPIAGPALYLVFGMDRIRRGAAERRASRRMLDRLAALHSTFDQMTVDTASTHGHPAAHIFAATDPAVVPNRVLRGNRAELMVDGDEFYPALFEAIDEAEGSIHLQTFILARDRIGRDLRQRLVARARDGITVRVLYDRFGSTGAHLFRFLEPLRKAGGEVRSISQANPLKGRFQINLRNHRKVAVIDGRTAFAGGMNLDEKNVSWYDRGADRDYHMRLRGPAVADLQFQFVEDWYFAGPGDPVELLSEKYFPPLEEAGEGFVQIVPGAPESGGRGLADAFFGAIASAVGSVWIVTPYFVPDEPILHALRHAAIRGVDVRLILPRRSNHWYTTWAARALYTFLLKAGVRVFERGPPFAHAKAMLVDDVYAMIGSANLDYRSLHLNFELNVEIADDTLVRRLGEELERDMAASREITFAEHQARSNFRRLGENFCRLFQPVL